MSSCAAAAGEYRPSSLVETFHGIPHIDIDLNELNATYDSSIDNYFETVIIWSCLPVLVGIILILLSAVCWGALYCYRRCRKKVDSEMTSHFKEPSRFVKAALIGILTISAVLGAIIAAGCIYAEVELNRDLVEIKDTISLASDTVNGVQQEVDGYSYVGIRLRETGLELELIGDAASMAALDALEIETSELNDSFFTVEQLSDPYSLQGVEDDFNKFEVPRHWTVIGLAAATILLFILFFITVLLKYTILLYIMMVVLFIFMVIMWCASGAGLAGIIVSADLCNDPDGTILMHVGDDDSSDITSYFLYCNSACDNELTESVMLIEERYNSTLLTFTELNQTIPVTGRSSTLQERLEGLYELLVIGNSSATELQVITDCNQLHAAYTGARSDFCDEGFIYILTLFCAASALAFLLFFMVCFTKKYINVLNMADRWDSSGLHYSFSPSADLSLNHYPTDDITRQSTSSRRKAQYDGWVAGKTHEGQYSHRGDSAMDQTGNEDGMPPEYAEVLVH